MARPKKSVPAEIKETAVAASSAEVKKDTAKKETKPAAKKSAAPKAADKKPAAKRGRKPAADKKPAAKKTAAPKASESKTARKPKGLAYSDIVAAAKKKILAADITKIKYPIAANVEISGKFIENEDGDNKNIFYIYIDPDKQEISVEPYRYNDYDVTINADADELMNVLKGKKNIYDALSEGIHIHGNTKKSILLIHSAF